jgi:hypothetical protein
MSKPRFVQKGTTLSLRWFHTEFVRMFKNDTLKVSSVLACATLGMEAQKAPNALVAERPSWSMNRSHHEVHHGL